MKDYISLILSVIKKYYDKLLAIVVLSLLLFSLIYLVLIIGRLPKEKLEFDRKLSELKPKYSQAVQLDESLYKDIMDDLRNPLTIDFVKWADTAVSSLFVPERRVYCPACFRPVMYIAENCPFCGTVFKADQEIIQVRDTDKDGLPDDWEIKYSFDHLKMDNSGDDPDNDGFTNYEEFMAGTNPRDPANYPDIETKLYVDKVEAHPFQLLFKGISRLPLQREFSLGRKHYLVVGDRNIKFEGKSYYKVLTETQAQKEREKRIGEGRKVWIPDRVVKLVCPDRDFNLNKGAFIVMGENVDLTFTNKSIATFDNVQIINVKPDEESIIEGSILVSGNRVIPLPRGSTFEVTKDVVWLPEMSVNDLPAGFKYRHMIKDGIRVIYTELDSVSYIETPDKNRIALAENARMILNSSFSFQLNLRGDVGTYFKSLGDTVEKFSLDEFWPEFIKLPAMGGYENRSILVLSYGDRTVMLKIGETQVYHQYTAVVFSKIGNKKYVVEANSSFEIHDRVGNAIKYRVLNIDKDEESIELLRLSDQKIFKIKKQEEVKIDKKSEVKNEKK